MSAATWGSTAAERGLPLPCDGWLAKPGTVVHRAVDVDAPPPVVFRWLCQLRAAPYSYDLIDNFGRRSPQTLSPGLERLAVGQRVMTIFDLVAFETDRHITLVVSPRARWAFGLAAVTYSVSAQGRGGTRLLVRIASRRASRVLPWLDLFMMRRQLLNLKRLAEGS
jgi:hypothetical protein